MVTVLSRLCDTEATERDAAEEAELRRQMAALKLQVQADFGLLYDISYLITHRLRPAYDYHALMHQVGLMYQQVWCLHQALFAIDDVERRRRIVAPIAAAKGPLAAVLEDLARRLDEGTGASARAMEQPILAVRQQFQAFFDEAAADTDNRKQQDTEYGLNSVGLMLYHLNRFADAMDIEAVTRPLRTAELAQVYEAAER
jgi:hypothetical protein